MAIHSVTSGEKAQVEGSLLTRGPGVLLAPSFPGVGGWFAWIASQVYVRYT